jgi:uncharacterized protein (TIGR00369 family)
MAGVTIAEFHALMRESLPFAALFDPEIVHMEAGHVTARMPFKADFLRPGGTISGPILMGLADLVTYAAVLSRIGRVELAVTTSLTINFLRKPPPAPIRAEGRLLKLGRRLAVGEVELFSEGEGEMVAHVVATYSLPPQNGVG